MDTPGGPSVFPRVLTDEKRKAGERESQRRRCEEGGRGWVSQGHEPRNAGDINHYVAHLNPTQCYVNYISTQPEKKKIPILSLGGFGMEQRKVLNFNAPSLAGNLGP